MPPVCRIIAKARLGRNETSWTVSKKARSRVGAGVGELYQAWLAADAQEADFVLQAIRIIVRLCVNDQHFAASGAILQHGDERFVELRGAAQTGYDNREPRHGGPSLASLLGEELGGRSESAQTIRGLWTSLPSLLTSAGTSWQIDPIRWQWGCVICTAASSDFSVAEVVRLQKSMLHSAAARTHTSSAT